MCLSSLPLGPSSLHSGHTHLCSPSSARLLVTRLPPLSATAGQSAVQSFSHCTHHPRFMLPRWIVATGLYVHLSHGIQPRPLPAPQLSAVTSTGRQSQTAPQPQTLFSLPLAGRGASPKPARPSPGPCPQISLRSSKRPICLLPCEPPASGTPHLEAAAPSRSGHPDTRLGVR